VWYTRPPYAFPHRASPLLGHRQLLLRPLRKGRREGHRFLVAAAVHLDVQKGGRRGANFRGLGTLNHRRVDLADKRKRD